MHLRGVYLFQLLRPKKLACTVTVLNGYILIISPWYHTNNRYSSLSTLFFLLFSHFIFPLCCRPILGYLSFATSISILYCLYFDHHSPIISCPACHLTHCPFSPPSWTLSGQEDKKLPPPLPKKPAGGVSGSLRSDSTGDGGAGSGGGGSGGLVVPRLGGHTLPIREKSLDLGDRQRTEARRRLLQTKRAASFRQNSATESADSIEIYIPEAQTRLWTRDLRVSFSTALTSPGLSLSLDFDFE